MDQDQNVTAGAPVVGEAPKKSPTMLIIGAVVILVIIAWFALMKGEVVAPTDNMEMTVPVGTMMEGDMAAPSDAAAMGMPAAEGTSDEIGAIEADLNATDLNALNEVDQI